jgi:hypothetical protein
MRQPMRILAASALAIIAVCVGDARSSAANQPNQASANQGRPAAPLGTDYSRTRQRPVNGGHPSNRWRYEYYNGYWWFWTPRDQWSYFDGRRWNNYDPASLLARGTGGAAMRGALRAEASAGIGSRGRGGFGGYGGYGQGRGIRGGAANQSGNSSLGPMPGGSNPLGASGNAGAMGRGTTAGIGTTPGRSGRSALTNPSMGATAGGLGVSGAGGSVMGGAGGSGSSLLGGGGGSLGTTGVPGISGTRGSIGGASGVGIGAGLGRSGDAGSGVGGGMVGGAGIGGTGGGVGGGAGVGGGGAGN